MVHDPGQDERQPWDPVVPLLNGVDCSRLLAAVAVAD